jgi:hypothetical protein
MEDILKKFVREYDLKVDRRMYKEDAQRSADNPILYVFIGDSTKEAYKYISSNTIRKWDNGKGITFINISTKVEEDKDNCFNFHFSFEGGDKRYLRKGIRDKFYSDKGTLESLNDKITKARDKILSDGNLFNSFENINIALITFSDDPLNIITPEITILIRKKLLEVFKLSSADLYILIKEKAVEDEFFSKAVSVGFFKEIEYIQKANFKFNEKIEVYGENRELSVTWQGPVFYMTYVLEEKNERGIIPFSSMKNNYEIISYISLLKNRNLAVETYADTENIYYDNSRFKANINSENSINRYITAGLSRVKRPNGAIFVTVIRAFYEKIIKELKQFSIKDKEFIVKILKLQEEDINSKIESVMPKNIDISDMNGIMISNFTGVLKKISKFTLREIEENLYGDRCNNFFSENFIKASEENLSKVNLRKEVRELIKNNILENGKLGLYCVFQWTSEEGEAIKYIRDTKILIDHYIQNLNNELQRMYESRLSESFRLKSLFNLNGNLQAVKEKIFSEIYVKKLQIFKLQLSKKILDKYEAIFLEMNIEISSEIEELNFALKEIKSYEEEIIKHQDEYTAQNVKVYYENIVDYIVDKLEKNYGEKFYIEDKYIGNLSDYIKSGKDKVLTRIIEFCSNYILTQAEFFYSFEEEFNKRANVNINDFKSTVFCKEDLYRRLYSILEDNSALKSYLMNYDVKGYGEKYFFGDHSSDFIRYAFNFDRKTRSYKIGYVNEIRSSGIEKLNLMGGFAAKDLIYIRTAMEFYNYCIENGYMLHGIEIEKLPEIS